MSLVFDDVFLQGAILGLVLLLLYLFLMKIYDQWR